MRGRLALYWVVWFVVSEALWLLLTSTVSFNEVLTGLAAAAIAASAATLVHAQEPVRTSARASWLGYVALLPVRIIVETWMATVALVRHLTGRRVRAQFREVRYPTTLRAAERRGFEALSTIVVAMSANRFIVGFDEKRHVALLHELVPASEDRLEEVLRGR